MASAKIWSLLGSARSLSRVASSRLRKVSAATSGLSRSGSENTASKAITTAPSLVRLVMMSAIRVRGHGHWPSLDRQALVVDIDDGDRPHRLYARIDQLETVEGADPQFLDRGGSQTRARQSRPAAQGTPAGHSRTSA